MIVAVIGLGTFGAKTATKLYEKGAEVIAIDRNGDLVDKIKDRVTHAVAVDVTSERALRSINISDVDIAVVALGDNIEVSIMAVAMLRKLGAGRVIARATNPLHEHILEEIGASEIIKVGRRRWAKLSLLRLWLLMYCNGIVLPLATPL